MKKLIITVFVAIMSVSAANAQWYVGGSVSYTSKYDKTGDGISLYENRLSNIAFSPRVGYVFSNNMLAGVELFVMSNKKFSNSVLNGPTITEIGFGVRPYYRYNFVSLGKFNIGAEIGVDVGDYIVKGSNSPNTKNIAVGVDIAPVITFALNKHFWIETKLDILGINYRYTRSYIEEANDNYTSSSSFSGIIDGDSLLTLGNIKFGVVYRF